MNQATETPQPADDGRGLSEQLGPVRYVLCPGYVVSQSDGQRHYIQPYDLARLYGVPMSACTMPPDAHMPSSVHEHFWRKHAGLPKLAPRYDGNYSLPAGPNVEFCGAPAEHSSNHPAGARP